MTGPRVSRTRSSESGDPADTAGAEEADTSGEGASKVSPGRRKPPWARELAIGAVLAVIGAIAAAAVGLAIGIFRTDPEPSGDVSVRQTLRNQTLRMFRAEAAESRPGEALGLVLDVVRTGKDVAPGGCRLVWSFLDADGPTPVADPSLVAQPAKHVRPDPTSCTTQARLWVPLAAGLEGYENIAVRVELYAADDLLGSATSETVPLG